jgi:hypothetical protein
MHHSAGNPGGATFVWEEFQPPPPPKEIGEAGINPLWEN